MIFSENRFPLFGIMRERRISGLFGGQDGLAPQGKSH